MEEASAVKHAQIFPTADKGQSYTRDGFRNLISRLGLSSSPSTVDNALSAGHYDFNLMTRNRLQLEAAYRGSWIVGRVVDTVADDMTREGIEITTDEGVDNLTEVRVQMKRLGVWESISDVIKWSRLYGGSIGVIQLKGQKLDTPLDADTVTKGQFQGLAVYDRWQLNPSLGEIINSGPDIGLPKFYDIVMGDNQNDPGLAPGAREGSSPASSGGGCIRVHHTRCVRMIGIKLPYFQAITEMMWGESILERMWDRLIEFDTATASTGNLINRAQLRTVGINGLREILAAGGKAQENLLEMFEHMRTLQQNEGITLLDKEDEFQSTAYSFAGLSDVLIQFGQQVSGAAEIPLVALFGQSPAGMNATGESDLRLYYDGIKAKQEARLRNPIDDILKIVWLSVTGKPRPADFTFEFVPLWQMTATDKATVAKTNTDTILEAHESGVISAGTALKELKQASGENGLFTHITDEEIEEAEEMEPPQPSAPTEGDPAIDPSEEKLKAAAKPTGDSAWKKIRAFLKGSKS